MTRKCVTVCLAVWWLSLAVGLLRVSGQTNESLYAGYGGGYASSNLTAQIASNAVVFELNAHYDTTDVCRVSQVGETVTKVVSLNGSTLTVGESTRNASFDLGSNGMRRLLQTIATNELGAYDRPYVDFNGANDMGTISGVASFATGVVNDVLFDVHKLETAEGFDNGGLSTILGNFNTNGYWTWFVNGVRGKADGSAANSGLWNDSHSSDLGSWIVSVASRFRTMVDAMLPIMYGLGVLGSAYVVMKWGMSKDVSSASAPGTSIIGTMFPSLGVVGFSTAQLIGMYGFFSAASYIGWVYVSSSESGDPAEYFGANTVSSALNNTFVAGTQAIANDPTGGNGWTHTLIILNTVLPVMDCVHWTVAWISVSTAFVLMVWLMLRAIAGVSTTLS